MLGPLGIPSFPSGSVVRNPPAHTGDVRDSGLTPEKGRSPEKAWQSAPVFLPRESRGQRSLVGYCHGVAQNRTQRLTYWGITRQLSTAAAPFSTPTDNMRRFQFPHVSIQSYFPQNPLNNGACISQSHGAQTVRPPAAQSQSQTFCCRPALLTAHLHPCSREARLPRAPLHFWVLTLHPHPLLSMACPPNKSPLTGAGRRG